MWFLRPERSLDALRAEVRDPARTTPREELRALLVAIEAAVAADPGACLRFEEQGATLHAAGRSYRAGRFETPSLAELRARVLARPRAAERGLRLSVLCGVDPLSDIGSLQALAPPRALFQVASQFNCLEAPDPCITSIQHYLDDPTQGPRASVSAFPGTFLRHYAAPSADGGRFVQTDEAQLNLLEGAFDASLGRVRGGYLMTQDIPDLGRLRAALEEHFFALRVGVHAGVEVAFGYNWGGPVEGCREIAQVFTSTLALGGYSERGGGEALALCRLLLRAAYLGTLLAALSLDQRHVVLTLIGGGVFGNPLPLIWESLLWAFAEAEAIAPAPLEVLVNGRDIPRYVPAEELSRAARERGGRLLDLSR